MRPLRLHRLLTPTALLVALGLATATPAQAEDVGHKIIRLCTTGKSLAGFPPSAYAKALKEISATTEEYTECGQLIRAAQAAAASGQGGATPAGATTATPAEQKAIEGALNSAPGPIRLGGQDIHPGVVHANIASAFSTLPTPVLVLLAFLLACLLAVGGGFLRNRIRGGRAD